MIYNKIEKLKIRQTNEMVAALEDYISSKIFVLNFAHRAALNLLPFSVEKTEMLAIFDPARLAYENSITNKNIGISEGSMDVVLFDEQEKLVGKRISSIKRKVLEINETKAALIALDLTNIKYYTKGHQSDIVRKINELEIKIAANPDYISVVPFIQSLQSDLGDIFAIKQLQHTTIKIDKTKVNPLLQNLKDAYTYNLATLSKMYYKNLTLTFNFFPLAKMLRKFDKKKNIVKKNQVIITNPIQPIVNIPSPKFTASNLIYIENRGPFPIRLFTSINITNVIPNDALTIPKNSNLLAEILDLGPKKAKNLMLANFRDISKTDVKITIRTRRKKKK